MNIFVFIRKEKNTYICHIYSIYIYVYTYTLKVIERLLDYYFIEGLL